MLYLIHTGDLYYQTAVSDFPEKMLWSTGGQDKRQPVINLYFLSEKQNFELSKFISLYNGWIF